MFSAAVGAAGTSKDPFVYSTAVGERETEMTDAVFRGMERTTWLRSVVKKCFDQ